MRKYRSFDMQLLVPVFSRSKILDSGGNMYFPVFSFILYRMIEQYGSVLDRSSVVFTDIHIEIK